MSSFRQIHENRRWPGGDGVIAGILQLGPDEIRDHCGVQFTAGQDDLDRFQEAALILPSERPVLLMRYDGDPSQGTTVFVDVRDDRSEARSELITALGLANDAFWWIPE